VTQTLRGNGFRHPEPEVMGSGHGTHDLDLAPAEPIASGPRPAGGNRRSTTEPIASGPGAGQPASTPPQRSLLASGRQSTPPKGDGQTLDPELGFAIET
jgi:hypothetical protein